MRNLLLLLILVLCVAGNAVAERNVSVQRLDTDKISALFESYRQDCLVGNPNPFFYAIPNWIWGAEQYTYIYDPTETCGCPAGFAVEFVHMIVQFGPEDVPVTFDAYVTVDSPAWSDELDCWYPGNPVCASDLTSITIDTAGLYDIGLPTPDCACAAMSYQYSLSYVFVSTFSSNPDIVTDQFPSACTSWNDYGLGWYDLVADFGFPGNIMMWADIVCCQSPVANADETWGGVKSLYE
ncbi:hypothetical protein KKG45_13720 [bacterium]|nr:hypothetical protein [bacterium]MBU1074299.1 hypothetical protein [bacterium]MBU1674604.1 hypothetical protein [bacterium]